MTSADTLIQAGRIEGWMEIEELHWLGTAAADKQIIVEVGSWKGRSTKAMALSTKGVIYAIDHWEGSEEERFSTQNEAIRLGPELMLEIFKKNLAPEIEAGKVIPIQADSVDAIPLLKEKLAGRLADMVFIDGDHRYLPTKADIENYRPFVKPGGLLCGHDYWHDHPGVVQAVNELVPGVAYGARSIWCKVS